MKSFLLLLLTAAALFGATTEALVKRALAAHPSLQAIEKRLSAFDDYESASRNFYDPQLSLTLNDIQFDDPFDRSLEPMQYSAVNLTQKFPWFGKRDARTRDVGAKKRVVFASLEAARVKLAEAVRKTAYTIDELTQRLQVLDDYRKLTRQNIELNTAYTSTQNSRHMGIMSAELTLSQIKIRTEKLRAALAAQRAKLAYLVQAPADSVNVGVPVGPLPDKAALLARLDTNPDVRVASARTEAAEARSALKAAESDADPYVKMGYFYREAHPDYASITVGASLPIYGTQHDAEEAARKEALAARSERADTRARVRSDFERAWAELTEAYRVHRIIVEESLPQVAHMFDLSNAKIRSGGELFAYIDLLEQKLRLDEQRITAEAAYRRALATLNALTGETE